jgi:hypothetical protein
MFLIIEMKNDTITIPNHLFNILIEALEGKALKNITFYLTTTERPLKKFMKCTD